MRLGWIRLLALGCLVGLVAGCRVVPVQNVTDAPFTREAPSLEVAARAITVAGANLGWQVTEEEPGHLIGRLPLRTHLAIVDIYHDRETYSIQYKDSANLRYDGQNIHANYARWIANLQKGIGVQTALY